MTRSKTKASSRIDRRQFLAGTGAAAVTLGVGFYFKNPLLAMVLGGLVLLSGLYWVG